VPWVACSIIGVIGGISSPASDGSYFGVIFANMEWIVFFWAFMFTWFMVRHPQQSRFHEPLPLEADYPLLVLAILLVVIDLIVLGPGITIH
jgi:hypothetical protein